MSSFSDDFNRGNGNIGAPWVLVRGNPQVTSNLWTSYQGNSTEDLSVVDLAGDNQDVTGITHGSLEAPSLILCHSGTVLQNRGYRFYIHQGQYARLDRYPGPSNTGTEVSNELLDDDVLGEGITLRCVVSGSQQGVSVRGYLNGGLVADYTDVSPLVGSYAGLWSSHSGNEWFDSFSGLGTERPVFPIVNGTRPNLRQRQQRVNTPRLRQRVR